MEKLKIKYIDRNNKDKRKKKIIHPFDGRAIPLNYKYIKTCAKSLSRKFKNIDFDYVIGFAEGGIIPAFSVAQSIKKPMLCSYRVRMKIPNEVTFSEPHSAISEHYIYGLNRGDRVLIIEDEITTGKTLTNSIKSLEEKGIKVVGIGAFILNKLNKKNYTKIINKGIPFNYIFKLK